MVTTSPYQITDVRTASRLDETRLEWVMTYRRNHPEADWWAEGFAAVAHSTETQERVFRMAEQLQARGIDRRSVFQALRRADLVTQGRRAGLFEVDSQPRHLYVRGRAVHNEDLSQEPGSRTLAAAAAGCSAVDALLGDHGLVVDVLPREAFKVQPGQAEGWPGQSQLGRILILIDEAPQLDQLRAHGFDAVTFDGADPAAYAWAIFEIGCRAKATLFQVSCECHSTFKSVPIGVAIEDSSGGRSIHSLGWNTVVQLLPVIRTGVRGMKGPTDTHPPARSLDRAKKFCPRLGGNEMAAFEGDLKEIAKDNDDFRRVLFTGDHAQLVVMALRPREEIGEEIHTVDQILYATDGKGEAIVDGKAQPFGKGDAVAVPAGVRHNIRNTSDKPFKLFTIYAPPQHPAGTVHETKADAIAGEKVPAGAGG